MYLNNGKSPVDGQQIIDSDWVQCSITPDAPHLMPGKNNISDYDYGYGYQWWVLGKEDAPTEVAGDYMAIGIYNQFIYISPKDKIVIARNSAYPNFDKEELISEEKAVAFFRAVAKKLGINSSTYSNSPSTNIDQIQVSQSTSLI